MQTAEVQLNRAEKLVQGLSSEAERWAVSQQNLEDDLHNLTGNILLTAACIAYLGPFTAVYREDLLAEWIASARSKKLPASNIFSLERILVDEVQLRDWQDNGLPADRLSTENGIFIFNCRRFPLIIDPQSQGNKWIRRL